MVLAGSHCSRRFKCFSVVLVGFHRFSVVCRMFSVVLYGCHGFSEVLVGSRRFS